VEGDCGPPLAGGSGSPPAAGWLASAAALALVLLVAGCAGGGEAKEATPLGGTGRDDLALRNAVGLFIHEVLTEGNPEALRQFFSPDVRSTVDCAAVYQRVMGAPPGVYQPRFWDMKLLEIRYLEGGRQAHTRLSLECSDLRREARGGGKFVPLELDWVKQGENWFLLTPPTAPAPPTKSGRPTSSAGRP